MIDEMNEMLDSGFPFVEELLIKYGEFYPLAIAMRPDGSISSIATYDEDEHPPSDKVIADLKAGLKKDAEKGTYKLIAIFYDVRVIEPSTNEKTDAVAVFFEGSMNESAYTCFFPYTLSESRELAFSDAWRQQEEKEIFI